MSSDEPITDGERISRTGSRMPSKRYRVLTKPWRSPSIDALNQRLDTLAFEYILATFSRGTLPHVRVRSNKPTSNPFVQSHLPRNGYEQGWLGRRSASFIEALNCDPTLHVF